MRKLSFLALFLLWAAPFIFAGAILFPSPALAQQISDDAVKIGVLTDLSGPAASA